jgi:hypothetical protein
MRMIRYRRQSKCHLERGDRRREEILASLRDDPLRWQSKISALSVGIRAQDLTRPPSGLLADDRVESWNYASGLANRERRGICPT